MQLKRRVIMVGATFFLAAATGHLMQNGTSLIGGVQPAPKPAATKMTAAKVADIEPTSITVLAGMTDDAPAMASTMPLTVQKTETTPTLASVSPTPEPTLKPEAAPKMAQDCAAHLTLTSEPAAMVGLTLAAPCHGNARLVVRHSGLAVTGVTNDAGEYSAVLPALMETASYSVMLPDNSTAVAEISVPSLRGYDRFAVQWQGNDQFQLHAFEFGADYGDAGHVSAATPRSPSFALQGAGGFLSAVGDASVPLPMMAEVYTFPTNRITQPGVVRLTIEAEVNAATCGREMLGETLQARATLPVEAVDLSLAMPGCEAMGDYVVLKSLLPDVKLAAN
jgi:hypothetical protein